MKDVLENYEQLSYEQLLRKSIIILKIKKKCVNLPMISTTDNVSANISQIVISVIFKQDVQTFSGSRFRNVRNSNVSLVSVTAS